MLGILPKHSGYKSWYEPVNITQSFSLFECLCVKLLKVRPGQQNYGMHQSRCFSTENNHYFYRHLRLIRSKFWQGPITLSCGCGSMLATKRAGARSSSVQMTAALLCLSHKILATTNQTDENLGAGGRCWHMHGMYICRCDQAMLQVPGRVRLAASKLWNEPIIDSAS